MKVCSVGGCGDDYYAKGFCRKHYNKQYYENNKQYINTTSRIWREKNRSYDLLRKRQHQHDNKEHYNNITRKWHQEHKQYERIYKILTQDRINQTARIRASKKRGYWVGRLD